MYSLFVQITALCNLENLELRDCFVLTDVSVDRKCLPSGFGALPLTRLVMAPYAFNFDARQTDSLAELRGLTELRELVLESCQVLHRGLLSVARQPCMHVDVQPHSRRQLRGGTGQRQAVRTSCSRQPLLPERPNDHQLASITIDCPPATGIDGLELHGFSGFESVQPLSHWKRCFECA